MLNGKGIVGSWVQNPRFRRLEREILFVSVAGDNPLDGGFKSPLTNIRGHVRIFCKVSNTLNYFSFVIYGGLNYPSEARSALSFRLVGFMEFCTVTTSFDPADNSTVFTVTPDASAGGREYEFRFYPFASLGSTIKLSGGAVLGSENLTVKLEKENVTGDYR